jgi:hydrogenase maturation factor
VSSTPNPVAPHCETDEGCITCGDVAVELEVLEVDRTRGLALGRDSQDRRETVETALVEPVKAGDTLLVHAGTALAKLKAAEVGG